MKLYLSLSECPPLHLYLGDITFEILEFGHIFYVLVVERDWWHNKYKILHRPTSTSTVLSTITMHRHAAQQTVVHQRMLSLSEHVSSTPPAVNDGSGVGASELCVQDAVDDRVDAAAGPERQRREHVDTAIKHGTSVDQVCDGERQVGQSERQKNGENHVQRARALSLTALQLRQPPCRQFAELLTEQSTTQ